MQNELNCFHELNEQQERFKQVNAMLVNVYVEVSSKCPKKTDKRYSYILEVDRNGIPVTASGSGSGCLTYHQATLKAILEALGRISKPSEIIVHVPDHFAGNALKWLPDFAGRGFKTVRGKDLKNKELLNAILKELKKHSFRTIAGSHNYSKWLQTQMIKGEANAKVGRM